MVQPRKVASLMFVGIVALAGNAFGQSGTVTFVTGEVSVQRADGKRETVTRGTPVRTGDSIVTGEKSMAQLSMVDEARIALRPNTQFKIEQYVESAESDGNVLLNLVRGTLRAFTGLVASRNRDRFLMKTKIATVGIRGSGNVLFAGTADDCDPLKVDLGASTNCDITVNHTIEGSHVVAYGDFTGSGFPAQQGGSEVLVTGPGQTVLVTARGGVTYIPTPNFIAEAATNPAGLRGASRDTGTGATDTTGTAGQAGGAGGIAGTVPGATGMTPVPGTAPAPGATPPPGPGDTGLAGRTFGPSDANLTTRIFGPSDDALSSTERDVPRTIFTGDNGLGYVFPDPTAGIFPGVDPLGLQDIVIAGAATAFGQALRGDIQREGANLRLYAMYSGLQSTLAPAISGGTARDSRVYTDSGLDFSMGRWENASFGYFGAGSGTLVPGSVHWISVGSGYPAYLSDVLTGTATYTLAANTSPTNQLNTLGTLSSAQLDVNFSSRTLNAALGVSMPSAGGNAGGTWQLTASGVPITFGTFYASTLGQLRIANGNGQNSATDSRLSGNLEGSFVGAGLQGAIVGYRLNDQTATSATNFNSVSGVVGLQGPAQNIRTPYRDGLVSDPGNALASALVRNFSTANRPDEVTADANGRASAFAAPSRASGVHDSYALGTASIAQFGTDPQTGLVWGRWSGGIAQVTADGVQRPLALTNNSLHYVYSGVQNGPVSLPLTGNATYDLIGATSPTDAAGNVGTLNTASLAANFSARTVDLGVNLTISGQNIVGAAANVPIYRDQYFSAFRGDVPAGLPPPPQLLNINCQPACAGATGSVDGFFTARGAGAGMMYNLNGASGAAAMRRRGG